MLFTVARPDDPFGRDEKNAPHRLALHLQHKKNACLTTLANFISLLLVTTANL